MYELDGGQKGRISRWGLVDLCKVRVGKVVEGQG
jgi:hypothetical protein